MKKYLITTIAVLCMHLSTNAQSTSQYSGPDFMAMLDKLTAIMVNDVTSPVSASRYYAYTSIAAYEAIAQLDSDYPSLHGTLNEFPELKFETSPKNVNLQLSVMYITLKMGEKLLPSGVLLRDALDSLLNDAKRDKIPVSELDATLAFSNKIVDAVLEYSKSDNFSSLSTLPKYTPLKGPGYWQPTPPAYLPPVSPHWNKLRTFVLTSANQFTPAQPVPYSEDKNSKFYDLAMEVYHTTNKMGTKKTNIALFWDCNPFVIHVFGHMDFGTKKISPGAHWIGIAGIACKNRKLGLKETVCNLTLVSVALADAFIICWDEKFRSNRVRPETVINRLIDPEWKPLLQTPPFPEYTSGHSVASTVAAHVLTNIFGEKFRFTDTTEVPYGLPERHFDSFLQASSEAAISRLYGGIHYMDAIKNGVEQGKKAATFMNEKFTGILPKKQLIGMKK